MGQTFPLRFHFLPNPNMPGHACYTIRDSEWCLTTLKEAVKYKSVSEIFKINECLNNHGHNILDKH